MEYLGRVVFNNGGLLYPDSVVGTDSHTTMIDGLGVAGWGVGGIEAEATMLGQVGFFFYIITHFTIKIICLVEGWNQVGLLQVISAYVYFLLECLLVDVGPNCNLQLRLAMIQFSSVLLYFSLLRTLHALF